MSLCHHSCPPHNPNTPHVPIAELSGWEEQEGDSTSSIPTSLRSGATAGWFPMGIWSVCFISLVYFLPHALVCYFRALSQGPASTQNTSQQCCLPAKAVGLPEPGLRLEQGRRSGGQSRAGHSILQEGLLGQGLSPVLSSVLAALLQYAADPQDKHWLTEQQHMRAIGGKMVSTAGHRARRAEEPRARWRWQEDRQGVGTWRCPGPSPAHRTEVWARRHSWLPWGQGWLGGVAMPSPCRHPEVSPTLCHRPTSSLKRTFGIWLPVRITGEDQSRTLKVLLCLGLLPWGTPTMALLTAALQGHPVPEGLSP